MKPETPRPDALPTAEQTRPCAAEIPGLSKTSELVCPHLPQNPHHTR